MDEMSKPSSAVCWVAMMRLYATDDRHGESLGALRRRRLGRRARRVRGGARGRRRRTPRRSTGWARRCGGSGSATRGSTGAARPTRRSRSAATRAAPATSRSTSRASTASTAARPSPPAGSHARGGCSTGSTRARSTGGWRSRRPSARRSRRTRNAMRVPRSASPTSCATPTSSAWRSRRPGTRRVRQGRVDEGVGLLDEAMTVALGGETSDPLACGDACCTTLVVCDGLADLQRAADWCAGGRRVHRAPAVPPGAVLVPLDLRRRPRAQRRLGARGGGARGGAAAAGGPPPGRRPALPLSVLAGLRLRQGRAEEAAQLLDGLDDEPVALAPLVELRLQRGEAALAGALLDRAAGRRRAARPARHRRAGRRRSRRRGGMGAAPARARGAGRTGGPRRRGLPARRPRRPGARATLPPRRPSSRDGAAGFAALRFPLEEGRARLALARGACRAGLAAGALVRTLGP